MVTICITFRQRRPWRSKSLRTNHAFKIHHTFHETWPDILTNDPVYNGWDGNYAISRYIQDQCEELIGFRPDLLHPGIDLSRFRPTRECFSGGEPVIFHPARLLPWKGVHVTIDAFRALLDRGYDARLVLTDTQRIADWDCALPAYRQQILAAVDSMQLRDHVTFVSPAYAEMPALYDQADIVLYPTIQGEPYGLVPPEAMASGRPIIASRCGGISETVLHGETGWLVRPDDATDLADRIAGLLDNRALARRFGAAGRAHVAANLNVLDYVGTLERRYRA